MWIRTQENILVNLDKVESITIQENLIELVGEPSKIDYIVRSLSSINEKGFAFGEYATEARCIEVLDEIQVRLMGKIHVRENGDIEFFKLGEIYVMPKE